jgi:hypothetical protein
LSPEPYFGIRTVSITWMTPLLAAMSAFTDNERERDEIERFHVSDSHLHLNLVQSNVSETKIGTRMQIACVRRTSAVSI